MEPTSAVLDQLAMSKRIPAGVLREKILSINTEVGYIYFRIPKTANSTILLTLHNHAAAAGASTSAAAPMHVVRQQSTDRTRRALEHATTTGLPRFRFSFVRDPFERFASAYLDKVVRNRPQKIPMARFKHQALEAPLTVGDVLDYLESDDHMYRDQHWSRQTDLLPQDLGLLDFTGRFESLREDLASVVRTLFGVELELVSYLANATAPEARAGLLNAVDRQRIRKLYRDDFERLGYA